MKWLPGHGSESPAKLRKVTQKGEWQMTDCCCWVGPEIWASPSYWVNEYQVSHLHQRNGDTYAHSSMGCPELNVCLYQATFPSTACSGMNKQSGWLCSKQTVHGEGGRVLGSLYWNGLQATYRTATTQCLGVHHPFKGTFIFSFSV